jgi:hypothetical protein
MLDIQRRKQVPPSAQAVLFTRQLLLLQIACGALAAVLLLFHELFHYSAAMLGVLSVTLLTIIPITRGLAWFRFIYATMLILGAAAFFILLIWLQPSIDMNAQTLLTRRCMPLWLSLAMISHTALATIFCISKRVKRAAGKGFTLFEKIHAEY